MKVEKGDGAREKQVLVAMVTDKRVLSKIVPHWPKEGLLRAKWSNTVGNWCVSYFKKYDRAPKSSIIQVFEAWSEGSEEDQSRPDKDTVSIIEKFLSGLSHEFQGKKKQNARLVLDIANRYFSEVQALKLSEKVQGCVANGELKKALRLITTYKGIEISADSVITLADNASAISEAFDNKSTPLLTFPEAAGHMFGKCFKKDSFVSFMGKTKVGKSFWLLWAAHEILKAGYRVFYITSGDMSQDEVIMKIASMFLQRPIEAGKFPYPKSLGKEYDETMKIDMGVVERTWKTYKHKMTKKEAIAGIAAYDKDRRWRMCVHPSMSLNALGIQNMVDEECQKGHPPDAIIIDYMDVLGVMPGYSMAEDRNNINANWACARGIGQKYQACVITATQSDAASYEALLLTRSNFTDARKKLDHVTAMFGINQIAREQEMQSYRINSLAKRGEPYDEKRCLITAGALDICSPMVLSRY